MGRRQRESEFQNLSNKTSAKQVGPLFFRPIREAVLTVEKMKPDPAPFRGLRSKRKRR